jgi:hypothetical protein
MNAKVAAAGIFVIVGFVGVRLVTFMQEADKHVNRQAYEDGYYKTPANEEPEDIIPMDLPGLPQQLQASYDVVIEKDAATLEAWLKMYRPYVKEPKLSEIELDYNVKVGRTDPPKARKLFSEVAAKNGPSSPLRDRIDTLSKTYQ